MKKAVDILATVFYLGKSPVAPGTVGTLAGIPLVYGLFFLGPKTYFPLALLFTVFAVVIADMASRSRRNSDAPEIVIDEVAGFLFCFVGLHPTWNNMVLAFVFFRILDATKPFPISWMDRKIKGGLGIVLDDVAAGVATNLILRAIGMLQ